MESILGPAAALAAAITWTFSVLLGTAASRRIGAMSLNLPRLAIAFALFCAYGWAVRGNPLPAGASASNWLWLMLSGVVGLGLADLCLYRAFVLIGPRLAMLVNSFYPVAAALLAWAVLGERLGWLSWLGVVVTIAGITTVLLSKGNGERHSHWGRGVALAGLSALGMAVGMVLSKLGLQGLDAMSATQIRVLGGMAGFVVVLAAAGWIGRTVTAMGDLRAVGLLAANSFLGTFVGVSLMIYSLQHTATGVTSTLTSIVPVTIIPFSILVYRERVSPAAIIGAIVTVAGVAMLFI